MSEQWYVRVDGKEYGPYTTQQLKTYAAEGHVSRASEVRSGEGPWCLATKVKGMFPAEDVELRPPPPASAQRAANATTPGPVESEVVLYLDSPSMFRNHPIGFLLCVVLCAGGVGLIILGVWYLRCCGTHMTVTNKRTTLRTGILSKNINEVFHRDVRNVRLRQSFWQRILGVGSIELSSAGQSDIEISVSGMPDPNRIKSLINEYRDR